jgi:hypothetical protein
MIEVSRQELKRLAKELTKKQIQKELNISPYKLDILLARHNISIKKVLGFYLIPDDKFAKEYLKYTYSELELRYGASLMTIYRRAKKLGLEKQKHKREKKNNE